MSNNCRNLQLGSEKCYSKMGKEAKVFIFTKLIRTDEKKLNQIWKNFSEQKLSYKDQKN